MQSTQAGKGEAQTGVNLKSANTSGASSPNPRLKLKQKARATSITGIAVLCA